LVIIESEQEIFDEILHGELDFSSDPWPSISESAKDLVKKMLVRDPSKRITAHEVLCKFHHYCFLHYDTIKTYFIYFHI
jgi:serine/threonine protein kinase